MGHTNGVIANGSLATQDRHFELLDEGDQGQNHRGLTPLNSEVMKFTHDLLGAEGVVSGDREDAGVYQEIKEYCASCPKWYLVAPWPMSKAPLVPIPLVGVPFEQIRIHLVRSLESILGESILILVLVDYVTCYPEAVVICLTLAQTVASELLQIFHGWAF